MNTEARTFITPLLHHEALWCNKLIEAGGAMKKTTFTDNMIKKLKPEDSDYCRSEGNGFSIRVMPSGAKTWLYLYSFDGKRRKMNLGTYPDVTLETARDKFEAAKKMVKNGIDPIAEKQEAAEARRLAPSVDDLVKDYVKRYAKVFKRRWEDDERMLNKELVSRHGNRKAADIKKADILRMLEEIIERGSPATANQCLKIVRKMFNWAVEKDLLPLSPCVSIKMPSPTNERERALSEDEIKTFWAKIDLCPVSDEIRRALKLILVTAQRPGEVVGIHTKEIDGQWWTIPAERAKNGKTHRVYLTPMALDLIGSLKVMDTETGEMKDKGFIFPCPHLSKDKSIEAHALAVAVRRGALKVPMLDKNGKQLFTKEGTPATENKIGVDHFTPHDLRRTAATFMAKSGEMDEVIDAVLNHAKQGVIKVYNQYRYDREKQLALETWERKLNSIITIAPSNIVPFRKAANGQG